MDEKEENIVQDYRSEICELVRTNKHNYINGESRLSKYVTFSQYENIEKIADI